jgi:hypothetical protein
MTQQIKALVLAAVLLTASGAAAGERIVAVGDIHGSYDGLVSILQRAELIDAETHWIGGEATLVQVGDIFDRGLHLREVLDLLMRLQEEADLAGGRFFVLLGNHEGMNLTGFFRDVNSEIYAAFTDGKSEKRRKAAFKNFKKYWNATTEAAGVEAPEITSEIKDQWMAAIPPGWLEYNEALGPDGQYGAWLRSLPVAVIIDDVLFMHGGLGPALEGMTVEEINAEVAAELATYDSTRRYMIKKRMVPATAGLNSMLAAYREQDPPDPALAGLANADTWLIHSADGPLWFRGNAKWDEESHTAEVAELLAGIGAAHMVGGHTVQSGGHIRVRFGGRVILIDTGMLSSVYEGGRPSALVISDGAFIAIYPDGSEEVLFEEALPEAA